MKILIVSTFPTHPVTAGNRKGILNQVEVLRNLGHEVYFFYIYITPIRTFNSHDNGLKQLENYWKDHLFIWRMPRLVHLYQMVLERIRWRFNHGFLKVDDLYPKAISKKIKKLNECFMFDCCIVNYYFLSKLFTEVSFPIKTLFTHDSFAYRNLLVSSKKVGYNTTAHEEAIALQRTPNILSVNTNESIYFSKLSPQSTIFNIFSYYSFYPLKYVGNNKLLFFSGDNEHNVKGLKWFLESVFPRLKESLPNIEFVIGGSICKTLTTLTTSNDSIALMGYIENPIDFYSLGDIVINPISEGTGLKIKTFEAISFNKVVIAHPHSIEGIYKPDKAPVLVAHNPEEWVNCIEKAINSREFVEKQKNLNKEYLEEMNSFVVSEYKKMLTRASSNK